MPSVSLLSTSALVAQRAWVRKGSRHPGAASVEGKAVDTGLGVTASLELACWVPGGLGAGAWLQHTGDPPSGLPELVVMNDTLFSYHE